MWCTIVTCIGWPCENPDSWPCRPGINDDPSILLGKYQVDQGANGAHAPSTKLQHRRRCQRSHYHMAGGFLGRHVLRCVRRPRAETAKLQYNLMYLASGSFSHDHPKIEQRHHVISFAEPLTCVKKIILDTSLRQLVATQLTNLYTGNMSIHVKRTSKLWI